MAAGHVSNPLPVRQVPPSRIGHWLMLALADMRATPIASVRTAAEFSSVMSTMRELGVLPLAPVSLVGMLPDPQQRL